MKVKPSPEPLSCLIFYPQLSDKTMALYLAKLNVQHLLLCPWEYVSFLKILGFSIFLLSTEVLHCWKSWCFLCCTHLPHSLMHPRHHKHWGVFPAGMTWWHVPGLVLLSVTNCSLPGAAGKCPSGAAHYVGPRLQLKQMFIISIIAKCIS